MPGSFLKTGVIVLSPERRVDFANAHALELFQCRGVAQLAKALLAPERKLDQVLMPARSEPQEAMIELGSRKVCLQTTRTEHGWIVLAHDAAQMNALDASLQAASESRARERMSGTILHNIKGPMHAMTLALDILTKTLRKGEARQLHYIEAIRKELTRLGASLEPLLPETRRTNEKLELNLLISGAVKMMRVEAAMREVTLKLNLGEDAVVTGHARTLRHALAAVLLNALHSTAEGGEIEIQLACEERWARITITNTGANDHPSEEDAIDLYVARSVANAHGGEFCADSPSRFCFKLPLAPEG